jgi:hypothetical protein
MRADPGFAAASGSAQQQQQPKQRQLPRGEYLATIMDCGGCHTGGALAGQPDPKLHLAGSNIGFGVPGLGVFYPPNLTPDREPGWARGARRTSCAPSAKASARTAANSRPSCPGATTPR